MFLFSRKILCSIEAVLYIALAGNGAPVQSRAISRRQTIPGRYLEQPLQRLVRRGILRSVRGPRGGYVLARPPERIRLDELVLTVRSLEWGGEVDDPGGLSRLGQAVVMPVFERLDEEAMEHLAGISIADLMRRAQGDTAVARSGRTQLLPA